MGFTVIGMFRDRQNAQQASEKLMSAGFLKDSIDMSPYRADGDVVEDNRYYDYDEDNHSTGFWDWLFGSDTDEYKRYSYAASKSDIITVHAATKAEAERAAEILDHAGAVDVDDYTRDYTAYQAAVAKDSGDEATFKVLEEHMNVGKRTIETGGVRVRSRVIEKPVSEDVRLREERVYVRRNPVNRPASEADFDAFREGSISLTEHAEVAMAEKVTNVVEEITVGKEVDTNVETIRDTVRKTEVDVDHVEGEVITDTTTKRR
jgi:uncharacterized protein (TIGR02271 family)